MKFEWDKSKRRSNLQKHGIDCADVSAIFDGLVVTTVDTRFDYGEERFLTFGSLSGRVVAVVHTESLECIRIISARKASKYVGKYEGANYFQQI